MSSPIDSDVSGILNDPAYYDRTNPSSPFYDPTLDPFATNINVITPITTTPANVANAATNDPNMIAVDAEKARKSSLRYMRGTQDQQDAIIQSQQQPRGIGG